MLWMAVITFTSAWLPEQFRLYSIPLSVGITFFFLFLENVMKMRGGDWT